MELGLVDDLTTSDAYITELVLSSEAWEVSTMKKRGLKSMLKETADTLMEMVFAKLSQNQTIR